MWCIKGSPNVNSEHVAAEGALDRQIHTRSHLTSVGNKHSEDMPAGTGATQMACSKPAQIAQPVLHSCSPCVPSLRLPLHPYGMLVLNPCCSLTKPLTKFQAGFRSICLSLCYSKTHLLKFPRSRQGGSFLCYRKGRENRKLLFHFSNKSYISAEPQSLTT